MWKILSLIFVLPFFAFSEEIEVKLQTRSKLHPIYISRLHIPKAEFDWRYFDELRGAIEFDLDQNGFTTVIDTRNDWEERFSWPDVRKEFDISAWKQDHVPFVIAMQVFQNRLETIVFDIEQGTSKKYPDIVITGKVEDDRRPIHRLADSIQKDLFGVEGIASLKILYSQRERDENKWYSEIWICDSDGYNARQVTFEKGYCLSPFFLPPSVSKDKEFFYVSHSDGQSKIFRSSLTNPKSEVMVTLRGNQALPAITRRGTHLAFITDVAGRPDLFIQALDPTGRMIGKARQLFSASRATQASPTFSPDGKQVAFVSDKDGPPRIYLLDVVGAKDTKKANPKLLTKKNRENSSPSWSPDGRKLAYSSKVDGVRQIWIYDFDTKEEMPLTDGAQNKENPSWAPDSSHLVYNTESDDICELYLIHIYGGEPVLISKGLGQKRFASWEPR